MQRGALPQQLLRLRVPPSPAMLTTGINTRPCTARRGESSSCVSAGRGLHVLTSGALWLGVYIATLHARWGWGGLGGGEGRKVLVPGQPESITSCRVGGHHDGSAVTHSGVISHDSHPRSHARANDDGDDHMHTTRPPCSHRTPRLPFEAPPPSCSHTPASLTPPITWQGAPHLPS